jgi:peroxiredoxin
VAPVLNDPGDPTNGGVVEEGRLAPDFTLTSDSGEAVTLSSFRGDADGNAAKVMRRVKPDTHAADVLAALPG